MHVGKCSTPGHICSIAETVQGWVTWTCPQRRLWDCIPILLPLLPERVFLPARHPTHDVPPLHRPKAMKPTHQRQQWLKLWAQINLSLHTLTSPLRLPVTMTSSWVSYSNAQSGLRAYYPKRWHSPVPLRELVRKSSTSSREGSDYWVKHVQVFIFIFRMIYTLIFQERPRTPYLLNKSKLTRVLSHECVCVRESEVKLGL